MAEVKINGEQLEIAEKLIPGLSQMLQDGYTLAGALEKLNKEHTASDNKEKDASEIIEEYYESCARTLTELSKNPAHLVKYVNFINCITDSINKSKETLSTSYRASRGFL